MLKLFTPFMGNWSLKYISLNAWNNLLIIVITLCTILGLPFHDVKNFGTLTS